MDNVEIVMVVYRPLIKLNKIRPVNIYIKWWDCHFRTTTRKKNIPNSNGFFFSLNIKCEFVESNSIHPSIHTYIQLRKQKKQVDDDNGKWLSSEQMGTTYKTKQKKQKKTATIQNQIFDSSRQLCVCMFILLYSNFENTHSYNH